MTPRHRRGRELFPLCRDSGVSPLYVASFASHPSLRERLCEQDRRGAVANRRHRQQALADRVGVNQLILPLPDLLKLLVVRFELGHQNGDLHGQALAEERRELSFDEFADRFFTMSGYDLGELRSRLRASRIIEARIELATLALARYGLRTRDIADLLGKNPSTVTRWLNAGLQLERDNGGFRCRLDSLDRAISGRLTGNASMRYVAR